MVRLSQGVKDSAPEVRMKTVSRKRTIEET